MELFSIEFLQSQVVWTGVSFFILLAIMWKYVVPAVVSVLDARADKIRMDLDQAASLKNEAQQALATYEKQIKTAKQEAATIVTNARMEAEKITQSRMAALEEELQKKSETARKSIEQAKDRALEDVHDHVVEMAMLAVERILVETVDKKKASKLTDEAIQGLAN